LRPAPPDPVWTSGTERHSLKSQRCGNSLAGGEGSWGQSRWERRREQRHRCAGCAWHMHACITGYSLGHEAHGEFTTQVDPAARPRGSRAAASSAATASSSGRARQQAPRGFAMRSCLHRAGRARGRARGCLKPPGRGRGPAAAGTGQTGGVNLTRPHRDE
jgi:hypothetical protein